MMMPRSRACSAANSYSAMAVSRTRAAMLRADDLRRLLEADGLVVSPSAALVDGVNSVCGSFAACFRPAGSLMPEIAPVFW